MKFFEPPPWSKTIIDLTNDSDEDIDMQNIASKPGPPIPERPAVELSDEQRYVFDLVMTGENVFFTGPGGWYLLNLNISCITPK